MGIMRYQVATWTSTSSVSCIPDIEMNFTLGVPRTAQVVAYLASRMRNVNNGTPRFMDLSDWSLQTTFVPAMLQANNVAGLLLA